MKNLRYALVALTVLLLATAAKAQQTRVAATIPFDFVVGNLTYPAGDYLFSNNGAVLQVISADERTSKMILSRPCEQTKPSTQTKAVFRHMGGYYFLEQIWVADSSRGIQLPRSKSETRLAENHETSNSVIVAANLVH
jgi:hypothetical protein